MGNATIETTQPTCPPGAEAAGEAASPYARYRVGKERSAEILRQALAQMGRHPAEFNPLTFTLWYEYVSTINPGLMRAVDARIAAGQPIDDAAVAEFYRDHLAPADDDAVHRIGAAMQRLMTGIAQSADLTGSQAGEFGHQLLSLSQALDTNDDSEVRSKIAAVASSTAQMRASVGALQDKVQTSRAEIERLRADLERARSEALTDGLTGTLNRKGFDQRLQEMVSNCKSSDGRHCIVIVDIDHFKRVNDTYGHVAGDRVIQGLGAVLKNSLTDKRHVAARYGGEEFALLLPDTSLEEGVALAEAVRARVKAMRIRDRTTKEQLLSVTISAGVAQLAPGEEPPSFVSRADAALYESKRAGRDRVTRATG